MGQKTIFTALLLFIFATAAVNAVTVEGVVLDKKTKEPVVGANIVSGDRKAGTAADLDGKFSITLKALPAVLNVTYAGYKEESLDIYEYDGTPLEILLAEDRNELNEVVVVGYGTQKRKELTGSVASVDKTALEQNAVAFDALLSGAVAGLNVTQASGQPGAGTSIRIRGGNSINAANEPLYVIDGIIIYPRSTQTGAGTTSVGVESSINPLAAINPSDIESISVLKDVSATAIFGSRGANGVIIVTTKKGNRGKNTINYTVTAGWSTPSKKLKLMNAQEWGKVQMETFGNKGKLTDDYLASIGKGFDWQNEALQTGFSQNHEISVNGGDDKTRYLISGNYVNQSGIVISSGFNRYNMHINIDRDVRKNLTIGATATFGKSKQNSLTTSKEVNFNSSPFQDGITNSLTYALFMPPTVPIYGADGSFNFQNPWESSHFSLNGVQANPIYDLRSSVAESVNQSLLANFYARYKIIEDLVAKVSLSTDQSTITQNFFAPKRSALGLNEGGIGSIGRNEHEIWQSDATLDYSKHLADIHYINVMGGYTYQNVEENYLVNRASQFLNEELQHNKLGYGEVQSLPVNGLLGSKLHSLISRVNYTLLEKYNLTATFRADYSDRFAPGKRWGYFPSIGFAWNIDSEDFMQGQETLNSLKLRLSAGTVGNTEIGDFLWSAIYNPQIYNGKPVFVKENEGNSDLSWETTAQYNAGIDAGLFDERLNLVADVYYKHTYGLLFIKAISLGAVKEQMANIGDLTNKGIEFAANYLILNKKRLTWTVSANIARNINEITYLGGENNKTMGQYGEQIQRIGEPFGSFYGLKFNGIVQADEDLSQLPTVNGGTPKAGDVKFVDVNKDGDINVADRTILGSIHPDFTYGLSSTLTYKKFDVFVSFQGSQGNEVENSLRRNLERPGSSYNMSATLLDAWTPNNPSNEVPRLTAGMATKEIDSRYIEDGSYFRLKNITVGYRFRVQRTPFTVRVFASLQNLFTITKYKGYDPEVANGIDIGAYPTARTYSAGLSLTFN
ncbi:SusC/RagA family TonB-linked outer membrane protein [Bacteroidia bacterium]|nr:SusC/RagA family TonB-linked outer membrane protein [Bacteroidia bacterium]